MESAWMIFIHKLWYSKKLTHLPRSLFLFFLYFPTRELKLFRAHFLWNNLSLSASEINKEEAMPPAVVLFQHLYLLQQRTNGW